MSEPNAFNNNNNNNNKTIRNEEFLRNLGISPTLTALRPKTYETFVQCYDIIFWKFLVSLNLTFDNSLMHNRVKLSSYSR